MPTPVVVNGITYPVPLYGETGWAQGSGNLSQLLIALAAVTASTPSFMQIVQISTSPQTVATGHTYLVDTSSIPIEFDLTSPTLNVWFIFKDVTGNAETNNITLDPGPGIAIDGVIGSKILTIPNVLCLLVGNGTGWNVLLEI